MKLRSSTKNEAKDPSQATVVDVIEHHVKNVAQDSHKKAAKPKPNSTSTKKKIDTSPSDEKVDNSNPINGSSSDVNSKKAASFSEESVKVLVPSASISATIRVKEGKLRISTEGRPSGQMEGGAHGDHVTAQILSAHGIRRAANGIKVAEIDNLREARVRIFDFVSAIAVLNGSFSNTHPHSYILNQKAIQGLYARINIILDEYKAERYKKTEISILEKTLNASLIRIDKSNLGLSEQEIGLLDQIGGLKNLFDRHLDQNRASNRRLICDTFARLIEATSTYYYKIPNTAYPKINGYEAADSEGGNVNAALKKLEEICTKLKQHRNAVNTQERKTRSNAIPVNLSSIALSIANAELHNKETTYDAVLNVEKLDVKIAKLESCINEPLRYIVIKLKDLFHYPEIVNEVAQKGNGGRDNDPLNLCNHIARHLFIVFNVYPELAEDINDKSKIVELFLHEVINHTNDLGHNQGWPSLSNVALESHLAAINTRLAQLDIAKSANLYIETEGHRTRASSGAIEDMKERIISPAIDFIRKNFGLEEDRIKELESQLGALNLGVDESEFRREIIKVVQKHCRLLDVDPEEIQKLQRILLLNKEQERKMGGVL